MAKNLKPIPISAAERIAKEYGYDQVVVFARKTGSDPNPHGEHITTYGVNKEHCTVAGMISKKLQHLMGWKPKEELNG